MPYYLWIGGASPDARKYQDGDFVDTRGMPGAVDGGRSWTIGQDEPQWDLYEAIEDTSVQAYSTLLRTDLSFEGVINQPSGRVRETRVWQQISLDELKAAKEAELRAQTEFVLLANAATSIQPNHVIVTNTIARMWLDSVSRFLQDRMRDRVYDSDPKPYWARDVPVAVTNTANGVESRPNVTEAQWGQIQRDIGIHDFSATDANELVQADIDAAYGAADFNALAAIDVGEVTYGWPPVYQP